MTQQALPVLITRLPGNDDLPLPSYQSEYSAAMDVPAAVHAPVTLNPGDLAIVPCGFALAIPIGYEGRVLPASLHESSRLIC
jgi:dUTP pyrophosphatase